LDSGGLEAAVAGYERKAKVKGSRSDDAVGHVGNNVSGDTRERVGYAAIHGSDEQSGIWVSESRAKPVQGVSGKPSPFNQVNRFHKRYRRYVDVASIADRFFNCCPGNR
jgi:hypothetical protein